MVSPYEVLQVDPDADEDAVEAAYRERIKETHPDHGGSASEFRLVQLAYDEIQSGEYQPRELQSGLRRGDRSRPAPSTGTHPTADHSPPDRPTASRSSRSASDRSATSGSASEPPATAHVEYLDYDVLADRGWDLCDDDLFERAAAADLDVTEHGRIVVERGEFLLEAAEDRGFSWPYSCRGGACANCAVAVCDGELSMSVDTVLPEEQLERDIRLSCIGTPVTRDLQVVYNVKHLPDLEELRLPPRSFGGTAADE